MRIPLSYNKLKVKDFIACKNVEHSHNDKLKKRMALVTHFTGKDAESMNLNELKYHLWRVDMLLNSTINTKVKEVIWINGKRYRTFCDVTSLSKVQVKLIVDQAVTAKELAKDGKGDSNLHRLLGLVYLRAKIGKESEFDLKQWDDISTQMLDAKLGDVYPAVFFYSNVLERLMPIIPYFLMEAENEITKHMREVNQWAATRGLNS